MPALRIWLALVVQTHGNGQRVGRFEQHVVQHALDAAVNQPGDPEDPDAAAPGGLSTNLALSEPK